MKDKTLKGSPFFFLNITQFLGALNDNIYKLLIIFFLIDLNPGTDKSIILSLAGATFVVPFLLFSSSCGALADKVSKSRIILWTKGLEVVVMLLGMLSFYTESTAGSYATLFLMATQSTIFSPAKYGIVPEIVAEEKISHSNGVLSSFTYLAIIIGTFVASFITDMSDHNFMLGASICVGISIAGLISSFFVPYTPSAGATKKISPLFLSEIWKSLKETKEVNYLFPAILGSAYFLFIGAYIQLNIIPFATDVLSLSEAQGGYIFLATSIGIGTGSLLSGKMSGKSVELGLVPFGGVGIGLGLIALDYFSDSLFAVYVLAILTGLMGGIYVVPCDSYIQYSSPKDKRGRFLAVNNFLSFVGVLFSSLTLFVMSNVLKLAPDKGFTVVGITTLFVTLIFVWRVFDPVLRFIGLILSRVIFNIKVEGAENVSDKIPSVLICNHTSWLDPILMMGAQRRAIRVVTAFYEHRNKFLNIFYRLMRPMPINEPTPFYLDPLLLEDILRYLNKGSSVCVFIDHLPCGIARGEAISTFEELLAETSFSLVYVEIEKGRKVTKKRPQMGGWSKKLRTPALVTYQDTQ